MSADAYPAVALILLCAGRSQRFGAQNKLLANWNGQPLVRQVAETLGAAPVTRGIAVTGHEADQVSDVLPEGWEIVHAHDYIDGLSASLKAGIRALNPIADHQLTADRPEISGAIIALADMPLVTAAPLQRLIEAFDPDDGRSLIPSYNCQPGNPVLLHRDLYTDVLQLTGDQGARMLLTNENSRQVDVGTDAILKDADTADDLQALRRL